jgi:hypothetical protein
MADIYGGLIKALRRNKLDSVGICKTLNNFKERENEKNITSVDIMPTADMHARVYRLLRRTKETQTQSGRRASNLEGWK